MKNVEIKKVVNYSVIAFFLIILSYFLLRFFIHQSNIIFFPTFILAAILFAVSIFSLETSLLVFIFFIPLLNSLHVILKNTSFHVIYFLFLGLFLGSLINLVKKNKSLMYFQHRIYSPALIFIVLSLVSFVFTAGRLINFYPFTGDRISVFTVNVLGWSNMSALLFLIPSFLNYFSGFLLFFIVINICINKRFINHFFYSLASSFFIVFSVGLYQVLVNPGFGNLDYWINSGRINATLIDPNSLGSYTFILFPIFIGFGYYFWGDRKYLSAISFILNLLVIILMFYSGSRTGFLGAIIVVVFYFTYLGFILFRRIFVKLRIKKALLNVVSGFIIVALLLLLLSGAVFLIKNINLSENSPVLLTRIKANIDSFGKEGFVSYVSSGRNVLWRQAINMFLDYPISGVGIGQFNVEISNYHFVKGSINNLVDIPNNFYLHIVSEMGILPLIIMIWFFVEVILSSVYVYRRIKNGRFKFLYLNFLLCFIVMLIICNFGPTIHFFEIQYMFFIIIGVLINFRINSIKSVFNCDE